MVKVSATLNFFGCQLAVKVNAQLRVTLRVTKGLKFCEKYGFQGVKKKGQTLKNQKECTRLYYLLFKEVMGFEQCSISIAPLVRTTANIVS